MGGPAYYGGLAEGFVGVSPLNEATVAPGTQDAIDAVTRADRLRRVGRVHRREAAHHRGRGRHRHCGAGGRRPA